MAEETGKKKTSMSDLKMVIEQIVENKIDKYMEEIGLPTKKSIEQKELIEAAIAKKVKEIKRLAKQLGEDPDLMLESVMPSRSKPSKPAFDVIRESRATPRKEPPGSAARKASMNGDGGLYLPIEKPMTQEDMIISQKLKREGIVEDLNKGEQVVDGVRIQNSALFEAMMAADGDTSGDDEQMQAAQYYTPEQNG